MTTLRTRLSRAGARQRRCFSLRAEARSVVAPCQRTPSQPTQARPTAVSRIIGGANRERLASCHFASKDSDSWHFSGGIRPARHPAPRMSPSQRPPPLFRGAERPTGLILRAWWVRSAPTRLPAAGRAAQRSKGAGAGAARCGDMSAAGPLPRRSLPQPSGGGTPVSRAARPASLAGQCRHPSSCFLSADRYQTLPDASTDSTIRSGASSTS